MLNLNQLYKLEPSILGLWCGEIWGEMGRDGGE